jgi:hypothetical protein
MPKKKPAKKKGMPPKQFKELKKSIRQAGAILRGEEKPARVTVAGPQPDGGFVLYDAPPPDYSKLRPDAAEIAYRTMLEATGQAPKTLPPGERAERNPEAVKRGRKGGKKGGRARAELLSPDDLTQMAKNAADARWKDHKKEEV